MLPGIKKLGCLRDGIGWPLSGWRCDRQRRAVGDGFQKLGEFRKVCDLAT